MRHVMIRMFYSFFNLIDTLKDTKQIHGKQYCLCENNSRTLCVTASANIPRKLSQPWLLSDLVDLNTKWQRKNETLLCNTQHKSERENMRIYSQTAENTSQKMKIYFHKRWTNINFIRVNDEQKFIKCPIEVCLPDIQKSSQIFMRSK